MTPPVIASQSDTALVAAMAAQAMEDGALIDGAGMTLDEARAWLRAEVL